MKHYPDLRNFFANYLFDADPGEDSASTRKFISASPRELQMKVSTQLNRLQDDPQLSIEALGSEANRWFAELDQAKSWLQELVGILQESTAAPNTPVVKDSNGTVLNEGDSVQVIKDLKVKGGSSDLKRGTSIKKIHLTDDPEAVECRVDGSTLVLKTCFLKKV